MERKREAQKHTHKETPEIRLYFVASNYVELVGRGVVFFGGFLHRTLKRTSLGFFFSFKALCRVLQKPCLFSAPYPEADRTVGEEIREG